MSCLIENSSIRMKIKAKLDIVAAAAFIYNRNIWNDHFNIKSEALNFRISRK